MTAFTLVPANGKLRPYIEERVLRTRDPIYARGEDIPVLLEECLKEGINAVGVTGEDLWEEYRLRLSNERRKTGVRFRSKIPWQDPKAKYGKPALCLITPPDLDLRQLYLRLAVNKKYERLANWCLYEKIPYISALKDYFGGQTENLVKSGLFDGCIDIVYSGKSVQDADLRVRAVLFLSDIVMLEV